MSFFPIYLLLVSFTCSLIGCSESQSLQTPDTESHTESQSTLDTGLIIEEDFESGMLPFDDSGNTPEVIRDPNARSGEYILKSVLNQDSEDIKRTELFIKSKNFNFDVDKEYWVGVSIKLGEEFDDPSDFNDRAMLIQWHYKDWLHPEVRDAQPLLLRFKNDQVHVHNEVLQTFMASTDPDYGKWVDWVFHVKFSDTDGIIQVWRNGKQVVDWTGDNHQEEKHEGAYLKFGIYSSQYASAPPGGDYQRVVYHDDLRIAGADGSYDLVAPRGSRN